MATAKRKLGEKHKRHIVAVSGLIVVACVVYYSLSKIEEILSDTCEYVVQLAGFKLKNVNISGANYKTKVLIRKNFGMLENDNIFKLSTKEIYKNVMNISWVKSAIVQKYLPNVVNIKIEERIPIAIFQHNSVFSLIDSDGVLIEETKSLPRNLPLVSGEKANKKIENILKTISNFEIVRKNLETMTFVRERRWDIVVYGIKIKLPEKNIDEALDILSILLKNGLINKNTAKSVDLRISRDVIINGLKIKNRKNTV
jgi:cell division protein FtsQ